MLTIMDGGIQRSVLITLSELLVGDREYLRKNFYMPKMRKFILNFDGYSVTSRQVHRVAINMRAWGFGNERERYILRFPARRCRFWEGCSLRGKYLEFYTPEQVDHFLMVLRGVNRRSQFPTDKFSLIILPYRD